LDIFLPIAQMDVNILLLVGMGGGVGLLSGLFGVGGGFLLTPLLMFIGIPPTIAAASGAAAIVAGATAGTLEHSRAHTVDYKMAVMLFLGGAVGSYGGVDILVWLRSLGPANVVIRVLYATLLAAMGIPILVESVQTWRRGAYMSERRFQPIKKLTWVDSVPFKMQFPRSEVLVSFLIPLAIGLVGGLLAALMGVGGGFILVPLMLYVLRMRMHCVAGTSLFQLMLTCMLVTLLQAVENHTVDSLLAFLLALGSTGGAIAGTRFGRRLRADQLKILLAVLIICVDIQVCLELVQRPSVLLSHIVGN
jgi:uncharacterized membrane protein YfcA